MFWCRRGLYGLGWRPVVSFHIVRSLGMVLLYLTWLCDTLRVSPTQHQSKTHFSFSVRSLMNLHCPLLRSTWDGISWYTPMIPNAILRVDAMNCHELKDAEQQQQRSGREVEHLQTQLSAATADAWTIRNGGTRHLTPWRRTYIGACLNPVPVRK